MISIGQQIRANREIRNLNQKQFAGLIGVGRRTLSAYENDERRPSYDVLLRIAEVLNVSTDELLGRRIAMQIDVTGLSVRDIEMTKQLILRLREDYE